MWKKSTELKYSQKFFDHLSPLPLFFSNQNLPSFRFSRLISLGLTTHWFHTGSPLLVHPSLSSLDSIVDRTTDSDQHHVPHLFALLQPATKYQSSLSIPPKMLNVAKENHRTVYCTKTKFQVSNSSWDFSIFSSSIQWPPYGQSLYSQTSLSHPFWQCSPKAPFSKPFISEVANWQPEDPVTDAFCLARERAGTFSFCLT